MDILSRIFWQEPTLVPPTAGPVEPSGLIRKADKPTPTPLSVPLGGHGPVHWPNKFWPIPRIGRATTSRRTRLLSISKIVQTHGYRNAFRAIPIAARLPVCRKSDYATRRHFTEFAVGHSTDE